MVDNLEFCFPKKNKAWFTIYIKEKKVNNLEFCFPKKNKSWFTIYIKEKIW